MKKLLGLIVTIALCMICGCALADVPIDEAHFPDANMRNKVYSWFDKNLDGILSDEEAADAGYLEIGEEWGVKTYSLEGIQYLTGLRVLHCKHTLITSIDLSQNKRLDVIHLTSNKNLTSLDVSQNTMLTQLWCSSNQLQTLILGDLPLLTDLEFAYNQVSRVDLSGCPALTHLFCDDNQLTQLNLSGCPAIQYVCFRRNQVSSLDLSHNPGLLELSCEGNRLTELDVSPCAGMTYLYCTDNELACLDLSQNPLLTSLLCYSNVRKVTAETGVFDLSSLPGFDVSKASDWDSGTVTGTILTVQKTGNVTYTYDVGNGFSETFTLNVRAPGLTVGVEIDETSFPDPLFRTYVSRNFDTNQDGVLTAWEAEAVREINVDNKNGISDLTGIAHFPALKTLSCDNNVIASLDLSGNTVLQSLSCQKNQLTSLDLSRNPKLKYLNCASNQLTSLNVAENAALETIICNYNQLSALDVSGCSALVSLTCAQSGLASLNVSGCAALQQIRCGYNQLTQLDVSGCAALQELWCESNQLTSLDLSANSSLSAGYYGLYSNARPIRAPQGTFDLSALPSFDVNKASNWNGGTVSGTTLTVAKTGDVTYTYDCGGDIKETFTLQVTITEGTNTPGDVTGDGVVDGRDALRLMKYLAGQDVTINASAADVTGDGAVDGRDVLRLMKTLAGQ